MKDIHALKKDPISFFSLPYCQYALFHGAGMYFALINHDGSFLHNLRKYLIENTDQLLKLLRVHK